MYSWNKWIGVIIYKKWLILEIRDPKELFIPYKITILKSVIKGIFRSTNRCVKKQHLISEHIAYF